MTNKFFKSFFFIVVASLLFSCGDKRQKEIAIPQGMNILNLSKYGKPFSIFVPDTTLGGYEITEQTSGALDIKVGKDFSISINEQAADMELRKKDIKEDEVNKLTTFMVDEPDAIFWESAITRPEFHFLINKKIGDSEYSFEDIQSADLKPFTLEVVQRMFDSCKNISENK